MLKTLSGRFLILTIVFVMLAEILIFVPSVARFRQAWLQERLELAQIASLALLATPNDMITSELEEELLYNAEVLNIVLRRDAVRELILMSPMPSPVDETFDLRNTGFLRLIADAMRCLLVPDDRVIRVIGMPVKGGGIEIETTLREEPLRSALVAYALNILWLSLFISAVTAALIFLVVRRVMVKPIERVVRHMVRYRDNPEDASRIIRPESGIDELHQAETALADLQTQLTQSLKQKDRLAALGGAVARISHDLRNMLTTAQLLADRMEQSADPGVARSAPKLLGSLNRAINLCERTLAFGRAEEPPPSLQRLSLSRLVEDVFESDRLRGEAERRGGGAAGAAITHHCQVPGDLMVEADPEQLFRVFLNLIGNARQALDAAGRAGEIRVRATADAAGTRIEIADTGPGLPAKAREHLFQPFQGRARRGGSGLGLAISSELMRGHGGALTLKSSDETGTVFELFLPATAEPAASPPIALAIDRPAV